MYTKYEDMGGRFKCKLVWETQTQTAKKHFVSQNCMSWSQADAES